MISVLSRKILALGITLALAAGTTFPAYAQASTITGKITVPFTQQVTACNGEAVLLSGDLLLIFHETIDANGIRHAKGSLDPRHVRGVGSVTGIQYMAVGSDQSHFKVPAVHAATFTSTTMFNLISQGGTDNLQIKFTLHITINANGVDTALPVLITTKCVG